MKWKEGGGKEGAFVRNRSDVIVIYWLPCPPDPTEEPAEGDRIMYPQ